MAGGGGDGNDGERKAATNHERRAAGHCGSGRMAGGGGDDNNDGERNAATNDGQA